ncbi:MAG: intermembrane phospholipid transport protein YdbH family protein [Croceibacterium sp.]
MVQDDAIDAPAETAGRPRSFWRRWIVFPLLLILGLAFAALWVQRERIAGDVLGSTLESYGVPATYEIERIGGRRQVVSNIVVGDPARPDLTVERAEIVIRYSFGLPAIASVRLIRPRLYGTLYGGKLSFGALDPLLFPEDRPEQPFEFPDMRLALVDGRALLESDYGPVGFKAEGSGHLRGGFAGRLAAAAPELAFGECAVSSATLYGTVKIDAERPGFSGPLRLGELECGDAAVRMAKTDLNAAFRLDRDLKGIEGTLAGATLGAGLAGVTAGRLGLDARATFRDGELTASYELAGSALSHEQARLAALALDGTVRAGDGFGRARIEGEFSGRGFSPGPALDSAIAEAAAGMDGTLLGTVLRKVRGALRRESAGSSLDGSFDVRKTGEVLSVMVPQAHLTGGSGQRLVALSRLQYGWGGRGLPRLSGNVSTGGRDLPRIEGRIERRGTDGFTARLAMAEYAADGARLAIPRLVLVSSGESLGFSGSAIASGRLPGGETRNLTLPLAGNWSSEGGLNLWRQCIDLRFDALRLANLTLERRGLRLCPALGGAIVRYGGGGLRIAAGAPSLDVAGRLGETPIAIRSGAVGIAYPGAISARRMVISLGPRDTATTFAVEDLTANIGKTISGRFAGTDIRLFAVPLDLVGASGNWDYTAGVLSIADGQFRLVDRQPEPRFEPLVARGGRLTLANNVILAEATLRQPATDRVVTDVDIRHNLATGTGHADLAVPGLLFDRQLQPVTLSRLMLGVVANVEGTVTGTGRIDWNEGGVTSGGQFSSESLDFAAAFGPVKGASGTVVFTDLLGLTTAPDQRIRVASINPGIEIFDGEIGIEFRDGRVLSLTGGTWPFMGGTLTMRPVALNLGESEVRAYVLDIVGMEAARVVERLELANINATGMFDGTVPLIFDAAGNGRLVDGVLTSRGGGNISYVGALTYEDMGAVANFAFQALRSLDYDQMRVTINGPLTGEIITQVNFDGVSQGAGAKQNFITRRLANLPIRFVINIRASFYQLITNLKSLYDPASVRDPRELGLIDAEGNVLRRETEGPPPEPVGPEDIIPDEPAIQRRESEEVP